LEVHTKRETAPTGRPTQSQILIAEELEEFPLLEFDGAAGSLEGFLGLLCVAL
jgi:hypothetical protein